MSLGVLRFFSQLFSVGPKLIYQVKSCSKHGQKKKKNQNFLIACNIRVNITIHIET